MHVFNFQLLYYYGNYKITCKYVDIYYDYKVIQLKLKLIAQHCIRLDADVFMSNVNLFTILSLYIITYESNDEVKFREKSWLRS